MTDDTLPIGHEISRWRMSRGALLALSIAVGSAIFSAGGVWFSLGDQREALASSVARVSALESTVADVVAKNSRQDADIGRVDATAQSLQQQILSWQGQLNTTMLGLTGVVGELSGKVEILTQLRGGSPP